MKSTGEDTHFLYHYTSISGIKGVIEHQNIRATNYKYLNDTSELKLAKENIVNPALVKVFSKFGLTSDSSQSLADFAQFMLYKKLGKDFYVASFCKHNDNYQIKNGLLSQWRAYGNFALVFNEKKWVETR